MNSREYLEQVRKTKHTAEGRRMDVEEARAALDLLRSLPTGAVGSPSARADKLQDLTIKCDELLGKFTVDFERYCALVEQADAMLARTRDVLCDGGAHAIDLNHVEVIHRYYMLGHSEARIAREMGYSRDRVAQRKRECLDWMDHARDRDGYPIVPIVSE